MMPFNIVLLALLYANCESLTFVVTPFGVTTKLFINLIYFIMKQKQMKLKADVIKWQHFSRKGDAIFRSLGREIIISTLSVATLTFAAPLDAHAQTVTGHLQSQESVQEDTLPVLEVTATRLPLPMEQAARVVNVISREEIQSLPGQSVNAVVK